MFNKALKRVLAGATVAAVTTLGVPALPAMAVSAPTLSVSTVDDWDGDATSGYTTLAGSQLFLHFQTKNLAGTNAELQVGFTRLTGNDSSVYVEDYNGYDYGYVDNGDDNTLWTEDTRSVGSNNVWSEYRIVADDAATVRVEAYIDNNENGIFDSGDIAMADKVVTFVKTQDAGLKVALKTPQDGRAIQAVLTSSNADLNLASLDGNNIDDAAAWWEGYEGDDWWGNIPFNYPWVEVKEAAYENSNDGFNSFDTEDWFDWNSGSKQLVAELDDATENYYYQSQLWYSDYNEEDDFKIGGTASVKAGPDIEGSITDITDVTAAASSNVNPDGNDIEIRAGIKTVTVTGTATDAAAGSHVYVYANDSENDYSDTYKVNGVALGGDDVEVAVKADGTFSFTVTTTDGSATDWVDLYIRDYDNNDGDYAYLTWNAAEPTITNTTVNMSGNTNGDFVLLDREVFTANLELKDQFGQFLTDGTYKVEYTTNGAQDDVTFASGKAKIQESYRYGNDSTPEIVFDTLYKNDSEVADWNADNIYFQIREKNYTTFDLSEGENDTYADPASTALVNGADVNWDDAYMDFGSYADDVYGDNAQYAKVTYSAPGLAFVVNDKVYLNTVTVYSNSNGWSEVYIQGNKTGEYKVTVTSGSDSYTDTVEIGGSYLTPAKAVVMDMQTSELDVTDNGTDTWVWVDYKFFDKFGNPTYYVDYEDDLTGSIVGDTDTTVYEDWGFDWNGDNEEYYGELGFYVADTFSGTKVVKGTTGSFSFTTSLVIGAPKLTFSAPVAVKAGASVPVTFTLKDANGDPIADEDVTLTLAGKGYLSSNSTTTDGLTTNKLGQVTVNLVTSAVDTGASTITATSEAWDNSRTDYTVDKSASVTIASVLAVPTVKAGIKNVTVKYGYAAGKKVVIKVDGKVKYTGKPASNAVVSVTKALAAGKHTVVVTIGSLTVVNRVVTVK